MIKNILCVDDSPVELRKITGILEPKYKVFKTNSAKEAIELLKKEKIDLIFMDIVMPIMDGYSACRQIKSNSETKNIPLIFVSSKDQESDKVWGELQGSNNYIVKPYNESEILNEIDKFQGD